MGWPATKLAELAGLPKAQLSRYEVGKAIPRADAVAKIAKALNVRFEWLLDGEGSPETGEAPTVGIDESSLTLDLPDDLHKIIRDYADAHDLTAEMAALTLLREAMEREKAQKSSVDELADKIADEIERRLKSTNNPSAPAKKPRRRLPI